jgi:uncharacterized protein (UPF0332 family)
MREELKLLIEKAERSIKAAEELLAKDYFEFSVSRSYYAMLYCAQALLLSKNLSFSKHSGVISGFGKELIKSGEIPEEFHQYLIQAFKERQKADYDAKVDITKEKAREVLEKAKRFLEQSQNSLDKK